MCPLPTADHGPVCVSEASSCGPASARRHVTPRVSECLTLRQERREALIRHGLTRRRHIQNREKSNWSRCKEGVDPQKTTFKIHFRIPNMPRGPYVHRIDHCFPVLLLHNFSVKVGHQTRKHSRKGHDVLVLYVRTVCPLDQQRAAVRIHCDQTQNEEPHDFAGEVFVGLPAVVLKR